MQPADTDARHLPPRNTRRTQPPPPSSAWVGDALGAWKTAETAFARRFPECRGLGPEQLHDLYQDTVLALLARSFQDEEHLRNALRLGIRQRARNMHRDTKRRSEILQNNAPAMQRLAETKEAMTGPEQSVLAEQDRLIAAEFLAELVPLERQVFALTADGLHYRAIAATLGLPVNEVRKATRACETKRQRFQLLYDTGRLCGFRASTIQAFNEGIASQQIASRARTHLDACPHCRAASRPGTRSATRLAALLPIPILLRHPVRRLAARFIPSPATSSTGLLAGTAATKLGILAALLVTVAVATIHASERAHHGASSATQRVLTPIEQNRGSTASDASIPPRRIATARSRTAPATRRKVKRTNGLPSARDSARAAKPNLAVAPPAPPPPTAPPAESGAATREFGPEQPPPGD